MYIKIVMVNSLKSTFLIILRSISSLSLSVIFWKDNDSEDPGDSTCVVSLFGFSMVDISSRVNP